MPVENATLAGCRRYRPRSTICAPLGIPRDNARAVVGQDPAIRRRLRVPADRVPHPGPGRAMRRVGTSTTSIKRTSRPRVAAAGTCRHTGSAAGTSGFPTPKRPGRGPRPATRCRLTLREAARSARRPCTSPDAVISAGTFVPAFQGGGPCPRLGAPSAAAAETLVTDTAVTGPGPPRSAGGGRRAAHPGERSRSRARSWGCDRSPGCRRGASSQPFRGSTPDRWTAFRASAG